MLCKPASVIHSAILLSLVGFALGAQRTKTSAQADAENEIFNQREKPSTKSDQQSKLSKVSVDSLSDLELRVSEMSFTGDEYKAEIPENSMGRVYVNPADPRYANFKAIFYG